MKLSVEGKLRLAVQLAFLAGAGAVANSAYAEDGQPASSTGSTDKAVQVGGVKVTGSRIKQEDLTNTSSMTIISDAELKLQGTVNVETLLNNMPQVFAEYSSNDSNGATGTATVSLRDLGSQRTLVLIDGKRLMPGDAKSGLTAPDLNFIPSALVDSVEILSGGASAVYGSDAVAGVVNFKMKQDFDGFRTDSQISRTDHSDGTTWNTTAIWGSNLAGGKGNVTLFAGYTKQEAITQDKRHYSACSLTTPASGNKHTCQGSRTIPEGRLLSYDRYYGYAAANEAGDPSYYSIVNPNGSRTFINDDGRTFNFAPYNYFQRPTHRYNLGGFAHYEINSHAEVYGSAMFMDNRTIAQIAPSGIFGQTVTVPCNSTLLGDVVNPSLTDAAHPNGQSERDYLCNFTPGVGPTGNPGAPAPGPDGVATVAVLQRAPQVGPRQDDLRHTDYRIVIGTRGDIADGWSYDASFQRGQSIFSEAYLNDVSLARAQNALNGCTSTVGTLVTGCAPLDIFKAGSITPEAANYIRGLGISKGDTIEQVATASLTGDLGRYGVTSPLAQTGVGFAGGYEYRTESLDFTPDFEFQTGDLAGQGGPTPPSSGGFQVNELFSELNVPLVEKAPFVKLLQVDGAYRWSNYSNSANDVHSSKIGLKWAPFDDFTLRGSYQRATRAPSISELFTPEGIALFGGSDPCAGKTPQFSAAQCANTGVAPTLGATPPPGQTYHGVYGSVLDCSSGQCNALLGGNPNLRAEKSITRSFGIVLTPTFIKNFSATIDYFDIQVKDAINVFPQSTLVICALSGDPTACSQVHRSGTGKLSGGNTSNLSTATYVSAINDNTGTLRTKGVDFELDYRLRLRDLGMGNVGSLAFNFVGTYLDEFSQGLPGATFDCKGLYGINCGTPAPEWRHKFRTTWTSPFGLALSANWRYFGGVELDKNKNNPLLKIGAPDVIDGKIGVKQYLDLSATYTLPTKERNVTLRAGMSNVAGQNPPTVSSNNPNPVSSPPFGNGNTFPNVYDSLGRVMFVGLTADF